MKEEVALILESTIALFMRYGIKSVTMDDVARELGISKKTLYLHFTDRVNLVDSSVAYYLEKTEENCIGIYQDIPNPIDQLLEIGKFIQGATQQMNPSLLFDLKKYFPATWKKFYAHRTHFIENHITTNLKKGMDLKFYRDDMNADIISRLYVNLVDLIIDDNQFPKNRWTFKELHQELLMYHLHGILTTKGKNYLQSKKSDS